MTRSTPRYHLLAAAVLGLLATPAAASHGPLPVGPGTVLPDSPLYPLDVLATEVVLEVRDGERTRALQERTAEARVMQERGETAAMLRAAQRIRVLASDAAPRNPGAVRATEVMLEHVWNRSSGTARQQLHQALKEVRAARSRSEAVAEDRLLPDRPGLNATQHLRRARQLQDIADDLVRLGDSRVSRDLPREAQIAYEQAANNLEDAAREVGDVRTPAADRLRSTLIAQEAVVVERIASLNGTAS